MTDPEKWRTIAKELSPIYHVTSKTPPTLIIHGDKDRIVPLQQAQAIMAKFKENKVPAQLIVKEGADHGWGDMHKDVATMADWFDKYLAGFSEVAIFNCPIDINYRPGEVSGPDSLPRRGHVRLPPGRGYFPGHLPRSGPVRGPTGKASLVGRLVVDCRFASGGARPNSRPPGGWRAKRDVKRARSPRPIPWPR